ncbi:protein of unknown function DUF552 [Coriobacterium glomerans PW2]|uniref:Cell division protein SepF n=1 Tax=Coriobacterium glomerans (strain ATCC 49209 / DSM 20642 / JCM 10262 / PW2) TaxID=700015 RepID=F2NBS9_CORGP|nr:cell division protein SepF [Coriobacterium glomerans]AEB06888.1 protein of unknown function DUF552 [Coriobacterium glomerans PW2]
MGFLDEIKRKLPFGQRTDGYEQANGYDDDYYDGQSEPYDDSGYKEDSADFASDAAADFVPSYSEDGSRGVLGQTRRGEAESVAVYTRSGQLIGDAERHATTFNPPSRSQESFRPGAYDTPSSYAESSHGRSARGSSASPATTSQHASSIMNSVPQLPAYVLKPESYDDVETVVRRVRTKQPVALVFAGVRTEVAKRVLDFSYGFACGFGASVKEVGDRVFVVLPAGCEVKNSDITKLRTDGYLK